MKRVVTIFMLLLFLGESHAQLYPYKWRIGGSAGYTNYHGDLSPYGSHSWRSFIKSFDYNDNYTDRISYQFTVERRLNQSIGLMLSAGRYQFAMSDRFIKPNGELMVNAPNFDRSLNFQTDVRDIGLSLVFKPDNNRILSANSFIAPYFTLGFGYLSFDVNGDLYDDAGMPYDYSQMGIVNNGRYETNLPPLRTELEEGYDLEAFYTSFGLGIRFRLSPRWELFAQSDFKYAFTDYLDDVSGTYRTNYETEAQAYAARPGTNFVDPANPVRGANNNRNDWYIFHGFGIRVSLGREEYLFQAPRILPNYAISQPSTPQKTIPLQETTIQEPDTLLAEPLEPTVTENIGQNINNYYFTWINTQDRFMNDSLFKNVAVIGLDQEILHNRYRKGLVRDQRSLLNSRIDSLNQLVNQLRLDTTLGSSELNNRLDNIQNRRFEYQYSLDSLRQADYRLDSAILSLEEQKKLRQNQYLNRNNYPQQDSVYFWNRLMVIPDELDRSMQDMQRTALIYSQPPAQEQGVAQVSPEAQEEYVPSYQREFDQFREQIQQEQAIRDSLIMSSLTDPVTRESYQRTIQDRQVMEYAPAERQSRERAAPSQPAQRSRVTVNQAPERERDNRALTNAALVGGGIAAGAALSGGREDHRQPTYVQGAGVPVGNVDRPVVPDSTQLLESDTTLMFEPDTTIQFPDQVSDSVRVDSGASEPTSLMAPSDSISDLSRSITAAPDPGLNPLPPTLSYLDPALSRLPVTRNNVYFEVNQSTLNPQEKEKLVELAYLLDEREDLKLELIGFADNTGNVNYNLRLIDIRITHVRDVLINEMGVAEERIISKSGGVVVRGAQRTPSEQDRRVEVRVIKPDG